MRDILVLTVDYPPMGGGMARHCRDACASLSSRGHRVRVIGPERPDHVFDDYAASVWSYFRRGVAACLGSRPRMVVANTWTVAGVAAWLLRRTLGIRYAVFCHGLDVRTGASDRKAAGLMRRVLAASDAVIANSEYTARLAAESVPAAKVYVLNPGVDPLRFSPVSCRLPELRGEPFILSVGRLVKSKGHDTMIRSMPRILERFPAALYCIVGQGPQEQPLRELCSALGLERSVVFAGFVPESELARYYSACDLFVLASREEPPEVEGFGIVLLEAAASARPVVAARTGGIPDAVADGVTGVLFDPARPETLVQAVIGLLSDPDAMRLMGEEGRERVLSRFTLGDFGRRLEDILVRGGAHAE